MSIDAWASAPEHTYPAPVRPATCGLPSCDHAQCVVARTGGEVLCRLAGGDWDALPPVARDHYAAIAFAGFVAMWEAAVEQDMTVHVETVPEEPATDV